MSSANTTQQYQQAIQAMKTGRLEQATTLLRQVVACRPDIAECHLTLGLAYEGLQQTNQALQSYGRALSLKPDLQNALESYCRCLDQKSDAAEGYSQLAIAFAESNRLQQAEAFFRRALSLDPQHIRAHNNLGLLLNQLGRPQEAISCFQHAVSLDPHYANAQWNLALGLLRLGRLREGWQQFTWRTRAQLDAILDSHRSAKPNWDGSPFPDQTLLVRYEQGLGDAIQFIRYLPQVKALGGTVLVETPAALAPLFQRLVAIDQCIPAAPDGVQTVAHDHSVYLMDLPGIFQTDLETIPTPPPYLEPPPQCMDAWRNTFAPQALNVGIVWAGSPRHSNDLKRSCPLQHWPSLWDIPGIHWYSLQKGRAQESLSPELPLCDLSPRLHDLGDTAAAIMHLDLVISVDTSVLHLAGALNRPAWALLPFMPDWRWLLNRHDSPWYPSLTLFRQPHPGDWPTVFHQIKTALMQQINPHDSIRRNSPKSR